MASHEAALKLPAVSGSSGHLVIERPTEEPPQYPGRIFENIALGYESNGIAERFVRTLKEWLATHTWTTDQELLKLLEQFRLEFNDRPHQGIATPALSPNEFANRLRLT